MRIAFFDFDGTVTRRDSLSEFIRYAVGPVRYWTGLLVLSPILAGYVLKLVRNDVAKEAMMSHFFKGWKAERFETVATEYSLGALD